MLSACNKAFPVCGSVENRTLEAYGDISGAGVVSAFVATGYLVFLFLLAHYILVFDPECGGTKPTATAANEDQSNAASSTDLQSIWRPNPIDVRMLRCIRSVAENLPTCPFQVNLEEVLSLTIISLCDTQILTGFAILTSGFISLRCGESNLSAYHWQMIVYLAWFSTITHMSGLTILRTYLYHQKMQRNIRFVLMFTLFTMLLVSFVPIAWFNWDEKQTAFYSVGSAAEPSSPAVCFFDMKSAWQIWRSSDCVFRDADNNLKQCSAVSPFLTSAMQSTIFSTTMLAFGFLTRTIKLFRPFSNTIHVYLRDPTSRFIRSSMVRVGSHVLSALPSRLWQRQGSLHRDVWFQLLVLPGLAYFLMVRLLIDLIFSTLVEVCWLVILLAWGTLALLRARDVVAGMEPDVVKDENRWSFGQILPVFLLLAPLFSAFYLFLSKTTWRRHPTSSGNTGTTPSSDDASYLPSDINQNLHSESPIRTQPRYSRGGPSASDSENLLPGQLRAGPQRKDFEDTLRALLSKEYYNSTPWMTPCVLSLHAGTWWVTFMLFYPMNHEVDSSIQPYKYPDEHNYPGSVRLQQLDFWFTEYGVFFYCVVSLPFACAWTILVGLLLEPWLRSNPGRILKSCVLFYIALGIHSLYLFLTFLPASYAFFGFFFIGQEDTPLGIWLYGKGFSVVVQAKGFGIIAGLLYVLYAQACVYLWIARVMRNRVNIPPLV